MNRRYDASITCLCVTHGRPYHVNEAVESWRRQTHVGSTMLIVNDCPEQTLTCRVPGVRVVNMDDPIPDLSEKFNAAVALCDSEWVAWWEDDDISLPMRLHESHLQVSGNQCDVYKQSRAWFWEHGNVTRRPVNLFFGSCMFRLHAWRGATSNQPADKSAWDNMTNHAPAVDEYPPEASTFFVYRWGGTGHHDSGVRGSNENRFREFRHAVTHDPRFVRGDVEIVPGWKHDYEKQVRDAMESGKGKLT